MKIKFENALVLIEENNKFTLQELQVLVEDQKIKEINKVITESADRVIDCEKNILMPGFVNAHAHNVMTLLRGIKTDVPLESWLFDYIFPNETKLTQEDVYYGELLGIMESLAAGITCFEEGYFHFNAMIKAIKQTGIRARVGIGKDFQSKNVTQDLQDSLALFDKNDNLLRPVVYPHSIYTTTPEEMDEFVDFAAKNGLSVSTHLSETLTEVGNCVEEYKKTPPEYLEDAGFFDRPCTLYHCVHMDKDDIYLLKNYNVNVVTCPSSNLFLGSGICPVNAFLNAGVNVALGTDGPASNNSLDMFKEMFLVANLQKGVLQDASVVKVADCLRMATINGAKALGFENLGKIKTGFYADLILVDVSGLHHVPKIDLVTNLVYSAKSSDVYLTMVNGKVLYEKGKFNINVNTDEVIEKCFEIAQKFGN